MTKQFINQDGNPALVVIPINEWRAINATLEDRTDAAAVRAFLKSPSETFPTSLLQHSSIAPIRSRRFVNIAP